MMDLASVTTFTTLFIAAAALVASIVSVLEMRNQRRNDVKPVLAVIEKLTDKKDPAKGRSLYLVNMGQAAALGVEVSSNRDLPAPVEGLQTVVAPGRRILLAQGHRDSLLTGLHLLATYTDLDEVPYWTQFKHGIAHPHTIQQGKAPKSDLRPYGSAQQGAQDSGAGMKNAS